MLRNGAERNGAHGEERAGGVGSCSDASRLRLRRSSCLRHPGGDYRPTRCSGRSTAGRDSAASITGWVTTVAPTRSRSFWAATPTPAGKTTTAPTYGVPRRSPGRSPFSARPPTTTSDLPPSTCRDGRLAFQRGTRHPQIERSRLEANGAGGGVGRGRRVAEIRHRPAEGRVRGGHRRVVDCGGIRGRAIQTGICAPRPRRPPRRRRARRRRRASDPAVPTPARRPGARRPRPARRYRAPAYASAGCIGPARVPP